MADYPEVKVIKLSTLKVMKSIRPQKGEKLGGPVHICEI